MYWLLLTIVWKYEEYNIEFTNDIELAKTICESTSQGGRKNSWGVNLASQINELMRQWYLDKIKVLINYQ